MRAASGDTMRRNLLESTWRSDDLVIVYLSKILDQSYIRYPTKNRRGQEVITPDRGKMANST